jgi:hypothetical protein
LLRRSGLAVGRQSQREQDGWLLSKALPKVYGDKQSVEGKFTVDSAQVCQEAAEKYKKEEADMAATIDGQLQVDDGIQSLTGNDTETIERSACPALLRMGPDRTMVRRYYMISMC